jgi:hypothetical protein
MFLLEFPQNIIGFLALVWLTGIRLTIVALGWFLRYRR